MRTLGLYAVDPDKGEILYAACIETTNNCYMPPYIKPFSRCSVCSPGKAGELLIVKIHLQFAAGTIVQVMVEQPKFYYKVVPLKIEKRRKGGITRKVRYYVSDTPKAGFKLHQKFSSPRYVTN